MRSRLNDYCSFLKGLAKKDVRKLAPKVKKLHKEAFKVIDCGKCANCCKTMTPTYTISDIMRISDYLNIGEQEFLDTYLGKEEKTGDIVNRRKPCQFLDKNNRCTIYEVRPQACRRFPHTQRKDFLYKTEGHIQNLSYCPITFHVVKRLYEIAEESGINLPGKE